MQGDRGGYKEVYLVITVIMYCAVRQWR